MATNQWNLKNPQYIGLLMFKYIRRELTPAQEKILSSWRNLSIANEKLFQDAIDPEKIREDLKALYESRESAWRKLQRTFPELPKPSKN